MKYPTVMFSDLLSGDDNNELMKKSHQLPLLTRKWCNRLIPNRDTFACKKLWSSVLLPCFTPSLENTPSQCDCFFLNIWCIWLLHCHAISATLTWSFSMCWMPTQPTASALSLIPPVTILPPAVRMPWSVSGISTTWSVSEHLQGEMLLRVRIQGCSLGQFHADFSQSLLVAKVMVLSGKSVMI